MVKSKKITSKKQKEEGSEVELKTENTVEQTEGESESSSAAQENGEPAAKKTKKGKGKSAKSEEETDAENPISEQNGSGDAKKSPSRKVKSASSTKKPASEPARKSSRASKPVMKDLEEDESYEVEKIVDCRVVRGKAQYLVRWKGYSSKDDTWEDSDGLNCPDLLQKYKEDNPEAGKKSKKRTASKSPSKTSKKKVTEPKDYEVEQIVGLREKNGKKEFKIRWKGYDASVDSWEPEKNLSCQDLIKEYLEKHKDEPESETPANGDEDSGEEASEETAEKKVKTPVSAKKSAKKTSAKKSKKGKK